MPLKPNQLAIIRFIHKFELRSKSIKPFRITWIFIRQVGVLTMMGKRLTDQQDLQSKPSSTVQPTEETEKEIFLSGPRETEADIKTTATVMDTQIQYIQVRDCKI